MVVTLKSVGRETVFTLESTDQTLFVKHCSPHMKFVLQEGILKKDCISVACILLTCVSLYLPVSFLKWLKRFASVPMPVLNACFCKSKRTELFLDYEKVKCNGQHSKINLFSSLYYKVLDDNSDQNGKDSKKCKNDSSTHLVAL